MDNKMASTFSSTATLTTTTTVNTNICFDYFYLKTTQGILKLFRLAMDLLGFICIMASGLYHLPRAIWFSVVSMTSFGITAILLFFYLFHCIEKASCLPWILVEFIYCTTILVFYLIATVLLTPYAMNEAFAAVIFFGFSSMVTHGIDASLKFNRWRKASKGKATQEETT